MKLLLPLLLSVFINVVSANTYYFSYVSGDDSRTPAQAQNSTTPWKTINKLNNYSNLKPGDSILFNRGEIFHGTLTIKASGTIGNAIFYGSYGTGSNPVIGGLTTISGWTLLSGNIYYASLDVPNLNILTVDGIVKGLGRYPNSGYLNYESHTNNTSITDNELKGSANWTGAEVVIRKYRWIIDRHIVTAHSGSQLTYNALSTYGNNKVYSPVDGNGYFIQSHLGTLDQSGEWYYDKANNRLYMHFGSGTPFGRVVKAGTVDKNIIINSNRYITFNDMDIEGGNLQGVSLIGATNVTFKNCNFRNQGGTAVDGISSNYIAISGGSVSNALNNGISGEYQTSNWTIDGVRVSNIATIPGATKSGDGSGQGIGISGNNTTIKNNHVTNTGYNGISFNGNNALVENNFVDTFCTIKDDGGGIYSFISDGLTVSNRVVRNNIVLNGVGAFAGAEGYRYEAFGKTMSIYLDGNSNHTEVSNNVVSGSGYCGLFVNNNSDNQVINNLFYDLPNSIVLWQSSIAGKIRNMTITGNKFIAKTTAQKTMYIRMGAKDNPSLMATFDNNYYARPIDDSATISVDKQYSGGGGIANYTLKQWQGIYGGDQNSKKSPISITSILNNNIVFAFNGTKGNRTVSLDQSYIDVENNRYSGSLTLKPYSSVVLLKNRQEQTITFPPLSARSYVNTPFNVSATASSGLPVSFRIVSGPATISKDTIKITGTGQVTVEASQEGNADYNLAAPVTQSFTITKANQGITFSTISSKTYGESPFTVRASASSGLPVSFRIVSGPATLSKDTIKTTGTGQVTVEASQEGNADYNLAAPVTQSFTITKANQVITFPTISSKSYGNASFLINATTSAGLNVSFRIISGPATIFGSSVILTGIGTVTIEASQAGNASYNAAAPVKQSFTVQAVATSSSTCSATGTILREQWNNIDGNQISEKHFVSTPNKTSQITSFESPSNIGEMYAARISGYICPPQSGNYTFLVAGDNAVELFISTDDNPANKKKIAETKYWTEFRNWNKYPSQKSAKIYLEAGQRYYIEVRHKELSGSDHVSVAWQLPNGVTEAPIPGNRLSPYKPVVSQQRSVSQQKSVSNDQSNSITIDKKPSLTAYPNPFKDMATIQIHPIQSGAATLEVYDMMGRPVRRLFNGTVEAGVSKSFPFRAEGLLEGVYIIRFTTKEKVLTHKISLSK